MAGEFHAKTQSFAKTHHWRLCEALRLCVKQVLAGIVVVCTIAAAPRSQQAPVRVALIGFAGSKGDSAALANEAASILGASLGSDSRLLLIDQSIVQPALRGVGYDGSINMNRDEARRVGAAIGCDFFVTGKLETFTRSDRAAEEHEEALIGVMIIDGRTGALAVSDFIDERAATRQAAVATMSKTLTARAAGYADRMSRFQLARMQVNPVDSEKSRIEIAEDIPDDGSPRAAGFKPPEFLNRVKPDYTDAANLTDITAILEASVVFRADSEVGEIQIVRWAGFGLDEAAERAIRQLKFKPATRDGKPINVRAIVRYNFRRLSETAPPQPATAKPVPDLRQLFKTGIRPPN